ncbi:cupin domain-containing carboxymuconolactone decarboxylase family protein [Neptunitalea lumnitzerae]|uniref:4-carboxymuconolactone decarboxylase n=1 Tax=Neptunitalea lumnitzerae TaxID=2965509 RepID=A0ABQ5MF22_9FLAO|nr:carboxymuconolactone decarboxylase family protein [Neptunitalea sp. Y10]GLB47962.1 4-carboxymuconolactone decarboxylase [Neptunitalea sp. Y10]
MNKEVKFTDKGTLAPAEHFTGTAWVHINVAPGEGYHTIVGTVAFEPMARTNWHVHQTGQILMVTNGTGYYQEEGEPIRLIKEGDVIKIGKNVNHWHGGSMYQSMTHIAIVTDLDRGKTIWGVPVKDEDYSSYTAAASNVENYLTSAAIKNHEDLWPNYVSKLQVTDPELIEIFDNWAFDEVYAKSELDIQTRTIITLASTIGTQSLAEFSMFVKAALNVGVSPAVIKEVVYQSVAYVGVAKGIDFLNTTNEIFKANGIALPLEGQMTTTPENREAKGLELMKATFGERIDQMRNEAPQDLQHIQYFLAANCFGDYYTRKGMDIKMRELVTYAVLVSMGGAESQVDGHIKGNLNVGNNRATLIAVTTQLLPYIGYPRTLNALSAINKLTLETE